MVFSCSLLHGLHLVQAKVVGCDTSIVLVLEPDNNWVEDPALQEGRKGRHSRNMRGSLAAV